MKGDPNSKMPTAIGWYPAVKCWESNEGWFPCAMWWEGTKWQELHTNIGWRGDVILPAPYLDDTWASVLSWPIVFATEKEAEDYAREHDPDW